MREHKIKTYTFQELSKEAQITALNNYITFLLDCVPFEAQSEKVQKAINRADAMQTPWFAGQYVYEYAKDEIIENLKINEYEFCINGEVFNFHGIG